MIRVLVFYPNDEGATFDHKYCDEKHIPLAKQHLEPHGLVRIEKDKGISAADPSAPAPFLAIMHLIFNTVDEVHNAFKAAGREVMGDLPNYTNVKPQIQISEISG